MSNISPDKTESYGSRLFIVVPIMLIVAVFMFTVPLLIETWSEILGNKVTIPYKDALLYVGFALLPLSGVVDFIAAKRSTADLSAPLV